MKLYCLSDNPNKPCFILKFKSTTIMLDCGLDMTSLMYFLPLPLVHSFRQSKLPRWTPPIGKSSLKIPEELKECAGHVFIDGVPEFIVPEMGMLDFGEVDVILLSNYHCLMALPYITEYTKFKGVVFATEPTLQIARQYMEELVEYIERMPKTVRANGWKDLDKDRQLPAPLKDAVCPKSWRTCFNKHDVDSSLSKVQMVSFNEKRDVFGALSVMAVSSGFCLGSANWIIQSDYEKIAYLSGSSTLTTHPRPMEQAPLRNSDILIMTSLTQTPTANPDAMIGEFCVNAAMTLRNGGNVLVPCYASGVTYDLFECLSGHLDSCGLSQVPLYFISPVADSSLAYSNIFAEWLSTGKMSKVYLPEPPFPHAELVKNSRLRHYPNLHGGFTNDFKTPCIVFTGHPSLRLGDAVHFLELWGKSSSNTIIFTEPDFPYLEALAPHQPLAMKVCYCPIDTSLSFSQANKLIRELKPIHLVIAEQYIQPSPLLPNRPDLVIESDPPAVPYRRGRVLTLPVRRRYEKIEIDPEFAQSLVPIEVRPGIAVTTITGALSSKDNKHVIKPLQKDDSVVKRRKLDGAGSLQKQYMWGNIEVQEFVESLAKQGITDVKVEDHPGGHIVHLQSEDTLIQIEQGSTHIICGENEPLRIQLRDTLVKCLSKF